MRCTLCGHSNTVSAVPAVGQSGRFRVTSALQTHSLLVLARCKLNCCFWLFASHNLIHTVYTCAVHLVCWLHVVLLLQGWLTADKDVWATIRVFLSVEQVRNLLLKLWQMHTQEGVGVCRYICAPLKSRKLNFSSCFFVKVFPRFRKTASILE